MHLSNEHFAEVEILSFRSRCKIDEMSYEQTVDVRTNKGSYIRLFDFMGFAVNESRLGKKKVILCVPYIDGEIEVLQSGEPQLLNSNSDQENDDPSEMTLIAKVMDINREDQDMLVDAGFGEMYVLMDADKYALSAGDIIKFRAHRLDLLEILD